jgi:RNA polymerase sigma-70 factor (ECF subfamily)
MGQHAIEAEDASPIETELERLHPGAFAWALVCCESSRPEAEEVLQTAYLKVLDGRAQFSGRSSLRTWLFGVIRYTALERRRHRTIDGAALARLWLWRGSPEASPSPEGLSAEGEIRLRLRRLLGKLSARQREVLHLVFYEELTLEQAGEVLGLPPGTIRTHYQRGKARLRELLATEDEK